MTDKLEVRRGSGNVFRDHGDPDAGTKQMKAHLAAEITSVLNSRQLSARKAAVLVGVHAPDITNIRNAKLAGFSLDRLVRILNRLDRKVEVTVTKAEGTAAA